MSNFLGTDDLVSDAMQEDITSEVPCTFAIEDSTQDTELFNKTDQVSFSFYQNQTTENTLNMAVLSDVLFLRFLLQQNTNVFYF